MKGYSTHPQSSRTGAFPSDDLMSNPGYLLRGAYHFAGMQSVYSSASADWARKLLVLDRNAWNHITMHTKMIIIH